MEIMEDSSGLTACDKRLISVYENSVFVTYVNEDIVHAKIPSNLLTNTVVPGIAAGAEVEIVLLKNDKVLTDNLHLLGSRWLADVLNTNSNAWLLELINKSILMSNWDRSQMWVAVPLERKSEQEYCMPMVDPVGRREPLMNCGTTILADQFSGVSDNTLKLCVNSLSFLMGECRLGCSYCSIGLGNATAE